MTAMYLIFHFKFLLESNIISGLDLLENKAMKSLFPHVSG